MGLDQVDRDFKAQKNSTRRWSMFLSQLLVATHTVCYWKSTCGVHTIRLSLTCQIMFSFFISWFLLLNGHLDSRKPRVSQLERNNKKTSLGLDQVDRSFKAQKKSTGHWSLFLSQLVIATHTGCYWKSTCGVHTIGLSLTCQILFSFLFFDFFVERPPRF